MNNEQLRYTIKSSGYTQVEMAEKLGITKRALLYKLSGRPFKIVERRRLARVLKIPLKQLEEMLNKKEVV